MGELDFRKKRKNTNIRGTARKQGKNSRQRELRFENEKREKRSSGKRWGKNKKNTKGIVLWAVELLLVCMTAVFLVAAFGQRVNVIGDSMSPVLKNGNVVMINHFIYNIKDPLRGSSERNEFLAVLYTLDRRNGSARFCDDDHFS